VHGNDRANLELVLAQLSDTPDERRGAHFFCAAAVAMPPGPHGGHGESRVVEGTIDGVLLRQPRGAGGFGYDPIFLPYGSARTTAEMDPAEKDVISHRGQAFRALMPVLAGLLAD
jgi:XTP/dITP diphosphohydrolase